MGAISVRDFGHVVGIGSQQQCSSRAAFSDLRAIMRGSAYLDILALPVAGAVHRQFVHIVRKQAASGWSPAEKGAATAAQETLRPPRRAGFPYRARAETC